MSIRWHATWIDHTGQAREIAFMGTESRIAAGVDFKLWLLDRGEQIPSQFELIESLNDAEDTIAFPFSPRRGTI